MNVIVLREYSLMANILYKSVIIVKRNFRGVMMVFKDKDAFRLSRSAEDREKDKGKIFTIRLNAKETTQLAKDMKILNQVKPSTCLKQLALIGSFVLHNDKIGLILSYIMGNLRRNQALGILDTTTEIDLNVTQNKENCNTTN